MVTQKEWNCLSDRTTSQLPFKFWFWRRRHESISWLLFLLILNWNLSSTSSFCPQSCLCNDVALSVDCKSAKNLRVVPIFLNPQIKVLSLAHNEIKDIALSLQFYAELLRLDISHNVVETLGTGNFEVLKNLRVLNVSYNALRALENGVFTGLTQTEILDLSGNQLERLEREIFWNLRNIQEIILDSNRLEFLDWDLFHGLDSLERISAKFNFIQVIEPSGSFSQGTSGPGVVGSSSTWTLKNVRSLDVSSNQLTRVKDHGLVIFGALKELNLCCNYIHTLEEKAFSPVGHLERVNLSQNRLGRVPTESLEKLGSSLRQLDLSSNRISDHIPKHAFRGLNLLETLRVSDNPTISLIDPDALLDNTNLVHFEADYLSNLTQLSPNLLTNKPFLQNFSVKFAQISSLPSGFFQPSVAEATKTLDLAGNPIDCNCSAASLFKFLTSTQGGEDSSPLEQPHPLQIVDDYGNYIKSGSKKNNSTDTAPDSSSSVSKRKLSSSSQSSVNSHPFSGVVETAKNSPDGFPPSFPLFQVRCQQPESQVGIPVKDLPASDFEHCFVSEDHFQVMVICIAATILSLIFITVTIKLCCVFGVDWHTCRHKACGCSCCTGSKKEKPEKLLESMMIGITRRDLPPTPNFNPNLPNGKSISGTPTHMFYSPATTSSNASGNPVAMTMDFNGFHHQHYPHHQTQQHTLSHSHSSQRPSSHQQHLIGFSPQHHAHLQRPGPPVLVHYEYPDFPSMHRVKQVPSVLV